MENSDFLKDLSKDERATVDAWHACAIKHGFIVAVYRRYEGGPIAGIIDSEPPDGTIRLGTLYGVTV